MKQTSRRIAAAFVIGLCSNLPAAENDWISISNTYADKVLASNARFNPENAGSLGVDGLDENVVDLEADLYERQQAASRSLLDELNAALTAEKHPQVRQDLGILIGALEDGIRSARLNRDNMLPYYTVSQQVFGGIRALIDDQVPRERYPAAVVRLERYAGIEDGYTPVTELAKARTLERFDVPGLQGPYRGEVEQDLQRADTFISGICELLAGTDLNGWQDAYETLSGQLQDYNDWVRAEVLPRAREDFRLPEVIYEDALRNWGVDESPQRLIEIASQGYMDIRNEMMVIGALVAAEKAYESSDYRDVIRQLKVDGALDGDELLDHYYAVLAEIEEFLQRERIISLPDREAGIRIATAAETAASPAAHLDIPRLLGNTGEFPYFVIPQIVQNDDGSWPQSDDTYVAGSWTLTAHEARPGHEMQFSSMLEAGVSTARVLFAFNSANVEGWGLYAEAIAKPFMPLEAQLISLQYRLMRAARMFLDPMLNLGLITPDEAKRLIRDDVVISETWAQNEIERYTYRIPGQATAYYYGYTRMQALRTQTELALRDRFDQRAFHDFVLSQGLLPPDLLKQAVFDLFVPSQT